MDSIDGSGKIEQTEIQPNNVERASGTKEILCDGYFYDVTNFISRHPGGSVIKFYTETGEDATHAIQQFHQQSIKHVRMIMRALKSRPASDSEIGLNEKVLKKNRALTEDFTKLYVELESEGLFEPAYTHMILRFLELLVMLAVGLSLIQCQSTFAQVIGSVLIGLMQGRTAYLLHESGHRTLSKNHKFDRIFHSFFFGLGLGLSGSWWVSQHNRHHAMPQRLHHDVDLNTLPLLAYNVKVVKEANDGNKFWIQYQAYLFVLIDTLLVGAVWSLYVHPQYVFKHKCYLEMAAMAVHWYLIGLLGFWPGLISSWVLSVFLFLNFTLNHTHTPVTTEPTHWVEYSLLHTVDVEHKPWCDWWMGYLNYQIEHHLFPAMPQFRGALIKDRVKALATKHNIPYYIYSYRDVLSKTFKNMVNVGSELSKI